MTRKVLVTGLLGQDGSNMCEYLLKKEGLKVFGMARRSSNPNFNNCELFLNHPDFQLVYGDLTDQYSIDKLVQDIQPDYFMKQDNSLHGPKMVSFITPFAYEVDTMDDFKILKTIYENKK